ncbi:MAG TPA: chemotaxis protein CheB [Albitalea sp.]
MSTAATTGPPAHDAVVIGGSAGSLEALLAIVAALPADFALPLVVVVHMPGDTPSALSGALAPACALPVREPLDKEPVDPGTVWVAAPGYHLLVEPGPRFAFSLDEPVNFARPSIDVLFDAAADVYGPRLIGVVLSGANNDGAEGLAAVGRAGGVALVQAPEEAGSPQMPCAALAACPGAQPLPAAGIASRLLAAHLQKIDRAFP